MKLVSLLAFLLVVSSCATKKTGFVKERVCSSQSMKYLKNPRNINKRALRNPLLIQQMVSTHKNMQQCYEDFKLRSGIEEFDTCLVVGVDEVGRREYFNFSSDETELDQGFLDCAQGLMSKVPYGTYGTNYILIQSYQFYVNQ